MRDAAGSGWSIPEQVPGLVAAGYDDLPIGSSEWTDLLSRAREEHLTRERQRVANAQQFLLADEDRRFGTPTLDGLHDRHTADLDDDEAVAAVVRDGDPSVEVVLVRRDDRGYRTLSGRWMGTQGEGISDDVVLDEVVGSTVRLPARPAITRAATKELTPLAGWALDPWLSHVRALTLDATTSLGGYHLAYDDELGLLVDTTVS